MKQSILVTGAIAAFVATASPALAAPTQFDLVCKGTQQKKTGVPPSAWSERFRFDLTAKRWCRGACTTAAQIGSVTDDEIQIYDSRAASGGPAETQLVLERTTGRIREAVAMGWSGFNADIATGTCTRDLFSGMPGQKF